MEERDRIENDEVLEETLGEEVLKIETLDSLRDELEVKKREFNELQDKYLRLYAEFENFKKVVSKEQTEYLRYGHERLITEILPVVDNLERAIAYSKEFIDKINPEGVEALQGLILGVETTLKELMVVLGRFGVREIKALGEAFDPSKHHAVSQVETDECKPNMVIEEMRKGYCLHERVIRPSMVVVSKSPVPQVSGQKSGIEGLESEGD